jgi:hypothetical protein
MERYLTKCYNNTVREGRHVPLDAAAAFGWQEDHAHEQLEL